MRMGKTLERLSQELREMPRHRWDEHLREFCERLLMEESELQPARIPLRTAENCAGTRRQRN